jgi:hypothetical protein
VSLLPINRNSIVYGSADGGQTIKTRPDIMGYFKSNMFLHFLSSDARNSLSGFNLAEHAVGRDGKITVAGGCDIEVHESIKKDGHLYAIDLARMFPPQAPPPSNPRFVPH